MPSSYPHSILNILQTIATLQPKSILDVGFGRGKYGFLIKEYMPGVVVDGLEVYEPYITRLQKEIYRNIYIDNILTADVDKYDLYLLIDVIEHWEKDEVYSLLNRLLEKGNVLISTPSKFIEQDTVNGNEWERHKTFWCDADFKDYNHIITPNELSLIITLYAKSS